MFLKFILNPQKTKNLKDTAHYFWDFYQEKLATKFNKILWWALWVGDPRNFHNSFFVKNHYFNLNAFKVLQNEWKKNLLKKDASHLKITWHSKRQKRKKRKMKKTQTTAIFFFYFYFFVLKNLYFVETYRKKLSLCYYICIAVFPTWQVIGNAVNAVLRPKILGNRLGILT